MRNVLAGVTLAVLCPIAASAASVQEFRVSVVGGNAVLSLSGLFVSDNVTGDEVVDYDPDEIASAILGDYSVAQEAFGSMFGSLLVKVTDNDNATAQFSSCSGILSAFCFNRVTPETFVGFNPVTGEASLSASDNFIYGVYLSPSIFSYSDQGGLDGGTENYSYNSGTGGLAFDIDIDQIVVTPIITVAPVPLPAGGLLMMTGLACFGAIRRKRIPAKD